MHNNMNLSTRKISILGSMYICARCRLIFATIQETHSKYYACHVVDNVVNYLYMDTKYSQ